MLRLQTSKRRDQELEVAMKKGEEEAAKLFTSEKKKRELQSNLEELIRRTLLLLMNELPKRTWTALNVNWRM